MKVYILNDKPLNGAPFEYKGIAYPGNWPELATPQELAAIGILRSTIPDPEPEPIPEGMTPLTLDQFTIAKTD
jgi:hypothetical protein